MVRPSTARKEQRRTATWCNTLDPLLYDAPMFERMCAVAIAGTPVGDYAQKHVPNDALIMVHGDVPPYPSFTDLLTRTNLANALRARGVTHLMLHDTHTPEIDAWGKHTGIRFLAPSAHAQRTLEHKLLFDRLVRTNGIPVPPRITHLRDIDPARAYVCQSHDGAGLEGTRFVPGSAVHSSIPSLAQTLVREYLPGIPIGITLVLDRGGAYRVSAMRRQCFLFHQSYPQTFLGIQWLPRDFFDQRTRARITRVMRDLAQVLHTRRFVGIANIDLIVHEGKPYVLECNPRLSSATPQLFAHQELSGGTDLWSFLQRAHVPHGPSDRSSLRAPHEFTGSILQTDAPAHTKIRTLPAIGWYRIQGTNVSLRTRTAEDERPSSSDVFFFTDIARADADIPETFTPITLLSNAPLYDPATGAPNARGTMLMRHFTTIMFTQPHL